MSKRIKNFTSCKLVLAMKDVPTYDIAKQTTYIPKQNCHIFIETKLNNHMGRIAGTPNKITAEVKEKLESLIDGVVGSLDISEMNTNQRIKVLQIALQYTLPRLQATLIKEEHEDKPLFVEDIVVYKRKENSDEEKWEDNFEWTSINDL